MTIASVHASPYEVLRCRQSAPETHEGILAYVGATLAALRDDLQLLRCIVRLGVLENDERGYEDLSVEVNPSSVVLIASQRPEHVDRLDKENGAKEVPGLQDGALPAVISKSLESAQRRSDPRAVWVALECDALALRVPLELVPEGDVTLETWHGERWVPIDRRGDAGWLSGPWLDNVVPSPGVLRLTRSGNVLEFSLEITWSLWSQPSAPAWMVVSSIKTQLSNLGWECA